jgi:hypothetical protein
VPGKGEILSGLRAFGNIRDPARAVGRRCVRHCQELPGRRTLPSVESISTVRLTRVLAAYTLATAKMAWVARMDNTALTATFGEKDDVQQLRLASLGGLRE